jgi:succinate dehydrogenase / fumarate reductase, cytochrome b subunit
MSAALPGDVERAALGPVRRKRAWGDRSAGGRSFVLHRLTGIVLVLYMYVHLGVLSLLLFGESSWSDFLSVVTAKSFLVFDVVLLGAVIFHALNGIRVALVGSGIAVRHERALLWGVIAIAAPTIGYVALHLLGGV